MVVEIDFPVAGIVWPVVGTKKVAAGIDFLVAGTAKSVAGIDDPVVGIEKSVVGIGNPVVEIARSAFGAVVGFVGCGQNRPPAPPRPSFGLTALRGPTNLPAP